jgi:hypothetical protein
VKCKRKQDILALVTFKLRTKDSLGQGKGMANVQHAIRVGIGKGNNEFVPFVGRAVGFKGSLLFPQSLHLNFVGSQRIAFGKALGRRGDSELFHGFCGRF